jgi:hypothetical protein
VGKYQRARRKEDMKSEKWSMERENGSRVESQEFDIADDDAVVDDLPGVDR